MIFISCHCTDLTNALLSVMEGYSKVHFLQSTCRSAPVATIRRGHCHVGEDTPPSHTLTGQCWPSAVATTLSQGRLASHTNILKINGIHTCLSFNDLEVNNAAGCMAGCFKIIGADLDCIQSIVTFESDESWPLL